MVSVRSILKNDSASGSRFTTITQPVTQRLYVIVRPCPLRTGLFKEAHPGSIISPAGIITNLIIHQNNHAIHHPELIFYQHCPVWKMLL